ncbi:MAG TPA: exodeoxyribonuclease VII large subunit [Methylocella sp.]|nr:exodeoxyribonuclease VII large subunit [Methylocella sp.]
MSDLPRSNAPELSVTELSAALKRMVEDRFGYVRLRGEISNYRGPQPSGHAYFSLKDATARIDAVIWKSTFLRLKTKPQEGLEVIATGKVTTYPGKSSYQIVIEALEPAGIGALMALIEERRRKLAAEGLFNEVHKRPLPFLPARIGIVTSPAGAVIRDMLHRLSERFPRPVLVWPVRVQGETAAAEIAAAIEGLNGLPREGQLARPDVIIVARGGGSLEDLWSFNEEIVVRAAAASQLPLIAAVGHETDWTLIDYAADLRAPTPTAAAEKVVPVRAELILALAHLGRRQMEAALRFVGRCRSALLALLRALPQIEGLFGFRRQELDHLESRLIAGRSKTLGQGRLTLAYLAHRLLAQSPHAQLAAKKQRLHALEQRWQRWIAVGWRDKRQHVLHLGTRLGSVRSGQVRQAVAANRNLAILASRMRHGVEARLMAHRVALKSIEQVLTSLDHRQVLARGFAMVRDADQRLLRHATEVVDGASLEIEFADGRRSAVAGKKKETTLTRPLMPVERRRKDEQGSLF